MMILTPGKVNILIDGQFGSTGKGLFAGYLGKREPISLAITNAGPNAGHTYIDGDRKIVAYHLPISGIVAKCPIYLCAGAIINPEMFVKEVNEYTERDQTYVHSRAAVVTEDDVAYENQSGSAQEYLASTRKGVGRALARKIMRDSLLAGDCTQLKQFVIRQDWEYGIRADVFANLRKGPALMEVPQGMSLSLNHGLSYPHCTSREVSPAQAMSDLGLHPHHMGKVIMTLRTLPIRVGHIYEANLIVGNSGPCWPDQQELRWEDIGLEPELTTVTKRPRRIFSWSYQQVQAAMARARPEIIFLNFCNYVSGTEYWRILAEIIEIAKKLDIQLERIFTGWGPDDKDVRETWVKK